MGHKYIRITHEGLMSQSLSSPRVSPCGNFASIIHPYHSKGKYRNDVRIVDKRISLTRTMDGGWIHKCLDGCKYGIN